MKILKKLLLSLMIILTLSGCTKATRVNYNTKLDADNFKIRRKLVALNTRTNEPLLSVEGYISINTDTEKGELNVTIKTDEDEYQLFYIRLSDDVVYTMIQLEPRKTNPYAYNISFFPAKEFLDNGFIDGVSSDGK